MVGVYGIFEWCWELYHLAIGATKSGSIMIFVDSILACNATWESLLKLLVVFIVDT
jgi:hypothetical protein